MNHSICDKGFNVPSLCSHEKKRNSEKYEQKSSKIYRLHTFSILTASNILSSDYKGIVWFQSFCLKSSNTTKISSSVICLKIDWKIEKCVSVIHYQSLSTTFLSSYENSLRSSFRLSIFIQTQPDMYEKEGGGLRVGTQ